MTASVSADLKSPPEVRREFDSVDEPAAAHRKSIDVLAFLEEAGLYSHSGCVDCVASVGVRDSPIVVDLNAVDELRVMVDV